MGSYTITVVVEYNSSADSYGNCGPRLMAINDDGSIVTAYEEE